MSFWRHVISLGSGTAIGQLAVLTTLPLISNWYSPDHIGVFALFLSFVNSFAVGASFCLNFALVKEQNDQSAEMLYRYALFACFFVSGFAGLIFFLISLVGVEPYASLPTIISFAIAFTLFLTGWFNLLRCWHSRALDFKVAGVALISQGLARAILPLVLFMPLAGGWSALVLSELVSRGIGIYALWKRRLLAKPKHTARPTGAVATFTNYRRYPLLVLPSNLLDSFGGYFPTVVMGFFFGAAAAGEFFLVQRVIMAPQGLLASGIADVFFAHFSRDKMPSADSPRKQFKSIISVLSCGGLLVYGPFSLFCYLYFNSIFGGEWIDATRLIPAFSLLAIVALVVSPVSRILLTLERELLGLQLSSFRAIGPLCVLGVVIGMGGDFVESANAFLITRSLCYLAQLFILLRLSRNL